MSIGPAAGEGATIAQPEGSVLAAVREGDEQAFMWLVERHHPGMLRVAEMYLAGAEGADEVVQETWRDVVEGLAGLDEGSSFKPWAFGMLIERANARAGRPEAGPLSEAPLSLGEAEPAVAPDRFLPADHERWPGHWSSPPSSWRNPAVQEALEDQLRAWVEQAIAELPRGEREVLTLRDVEGWAAGEVCELLELSDEDQRALLHRARSALRSAVEHRIEAG